MLCGVGLCCTKRSVAQSALQAEEGRAVLWGEGSPVFKDRFIQDHSVTLELPRVLVPLVLNLQEAAMANCLWGLGEPWLQPCPGLGHPVAPSRCHRELLYFLLCSTLTVALWGSWMMYYRLVSLTGLSVLAEVVLEEPVAPWRPCPQALAEPALPSCGLQALAWPPWLPGPSVPEGQGCCADGRCSSFLSGVFKIQLYILCFIPGCACVSLQSIACLENVNILAIRL